MRLTEGERSEHSKLPSSGNRSTSHPFIPSAWVEAAKVAELRAAVQPLD